ncbi:YopX family protein [Enterococcus gallinarum]|uniref:YopX protein n=1 Tax=Siphoviridae sp. ct1is2 TaxID=2826273 RepID=A0A8S5NP43_9CAUD|nr:YopX family protein [Enterococcus gallinarum]MEB5857690.1 YopX family protein [Enterococcus gallinarum]DAD95819.1 MAG TPA: YopX protein [Siphoviridae sp. ct1is2]
MIPKFRAWEPDTKFMNDQVRVTSNRFGDGEILVEATDAFGWVEVQPEYLMQSTGLKDKNRVEVFQGDIVKVTDEDEEYSYISVVKNYAEEGYPAFDIEYPSDWEYESNALSTIMSGGYETIEIIGNIYENPELLEQANEN